MSTFVPTHRVTLLDATTTEDELGDEVGDYNAVARHVPMALHETSRRVFTEGESRLTTVRTLMARLPAGTTIAKGWRIRDEDSRDYYRVHEVVQPISYTGPQPVRAELRRVT